jgi:hypothetical protein
MNQSPARPCQVRWLDRILSCRKDADESGLKLAPRVLILRAHRTLEASLSSKRPSENIRRNVSPAMTRSFRGEWNINNRRDRRPNAKDRAYIRFQIPSPHAPGDADREIVARQVPPRFQWRRGGRCVRDGRGFSVALKGIPSFRPFTDAPRLASDRLTSC